MATKKKRINIAVSDDTLSQLERLAAHRELSMSRLGETLLEAALELQEDRHFAKIADDRLKQSGRRVAHSQAWQ